MATFITTLQFTDKGEEQIRETTKRAAAFQATAEKIGIKVVGQCWTLGDFDGLLIFERGMTRRPRPPCCTWDRSTTCTRRRFGPSTPPKWPRSSRSCRKPDARLVAWRSNRDTRVDGRASSRSSPTGPASGQSTSEALAIGPPPGQVGTPRFSRWGRLSSAALLRLAGTASGDGAQVAGRAVGSRGGRSRGERIAVGGDPAFELLLVGVAHAVGHGDPVAAEEDSRDRASRGNGGPARDVVDVDPHHADAAASSLSSSASTIRHGPHPGAPT